MHIGTVAFAANQITTTIESISFMPGWGFAVAATALVGQRIGAKDYKTAREYANISMVLGVGIMLLCSILFIVIPDWLISVFIKEPETIELGRLCLMVAAIEQPFMAMSMVLGGALKGAGDTKTPFVLSVVSSWAIRIPLMYVVIYILRLNVVYVWAVTGIQWIFEGLLIWYLFNRKAKRWGEVKEIEQTI
jgi:Na+-driven multidrug efflux pump